MEVMDGGKKERRELGVDYETDLVRYASVSRSLLPCNRSLLPYNRSLLPYNRSHLNTLAYFRYASVSGYVLRTIRSLLPYQQVSFAI